MSLPWTNLQYRGLDRLADNLPNTLLLLDGQRGNADDMAREIIRRGLCLSKEIRPCYSCKSCHLLTQDTHPDVGFYLEIGKIEQVRALSEQMRTTPVISNLRIIYLAGIDLYNEFALNALLKTLEEPQKHSRFILSAANRRAVKATILSRSHVVQLSQPSEKDARDWLLGKNFTPAQADAALALYHGNPHQAVNAPDAIDSFAFIGEFIAYLESPSQNAKFFSRIDSLPAEQLINILQNQLQAIIYFRQLDSFSQTWHNRLKPFEAVISTLDLMHLHTFYAYLSAMRQPQRQQIGRALNVKSLLLDIFNKRNLKL